MHGRITAEAYAAAVRDLNSQCRKYWPPGRMRAPVYTIFPFWFVFILTTSASNNGLVAYIYPAFFVMILCSIICQLGTVCWHYPTRDYAMVQLCAELTEQHQGSVRFRFFSLTSGGRSSAFYKCVVVEAADHTTMPPLDGMDIGRMETISCVIPPSVQPGQQMLVRLPRSALVSTQLYPRNIAPTSRLQCLDSS